MTSTTLNGKTDVLTAEVPATRDPREFISACSSLFSGHTNPRCDDSHQPRSEVSTRERLSTE